MNKRTESTASTDREYRTFDEFDVSKAMYLPRASDETALIETAVSNAIFDDPDFKNNDKLPGSSSCYKLDDCGNRYMQIEVMDRNTDTVVTINVTKIVETVRELLQGVMYSRLKRLQDSYDFLHRRGIYADNATNINKTNKEEEA